jgi:hypothetical protein
VDSIRQGSIKVDSIRLDSIKFYSIRLGSIVMNNLTRAPAMRDDKIRPIAGPY